MLGALFHLLDLDSSFIYGNFGGFMKSFSVLFLMVLLMSFSRCVPFGVDTQDFCITLPAQKIPGVSVGAGGVISIDQPITYHTDIDLSSTLSVLGDPKKFTGSMELARLTITAVSGVNDLSFIKLIDASVNSPTEPQLNSTTIASYDSSKTPATGKTIDVVGESAGNVLPYIANGKSTFTFKFEGSLPTIDWQADITMCFSMAISGSADLTKL